MKSEQQRGTCYDPSRKLTGKYILVGCWMDRKWLVNKRADIFHTNRWFGQEFKSGSQKKVGWVFMFRYRIVNSCNRIFCLWISSPQRFWEKPQPEIYAFTKKHHIRKKTFLLHLKLLQESSREIRWQIIQKISSSYLRLLALWNSSLTCFRIGISSWTVIKNKPAFLSTISCLSASKHFPSYWW